MLRVVVEDNVAVGEYVVGLGVVLDVISPEPHIQIMQIHIPVGDVAVSLSSLLCRFDPHNAPSNGHLDLGLTSQRK